MEKMNGFQKYNNGIKQFDISGINEQCVIKIIEMPFDGSP